MVNKQNLLGFLGKLEQVRNHIGGELGHGHYIATVYKLAVEYDVTKQRENNSLFGNISLDLFIRVLYLTIRQVA